MTISTKQTSDMNDDYIVGECSSSKTKYNVGDSVIADGKDCKVVQTFLRNGVYHVKNKDEPFDSFVINLTNKVILDSSSEQSESEAVEFPKFDQKEV